MKSYEKRVIERLLERYIAAVEGNAYEFSDDTFANDEPKPDESLDFEPTFPC